jgi:hypothetical protein
MASQHRRDDDAPERGDGERRHEGRLRDFARRILAERPSREAGDPELEREGYVPLEVAKDAMASILETGDRAKTEMVRMVAREVRHYLDELQLVEGMEHMLRNYRLEVHASLSLEPKGEGEDDEEEESRVKVEAKPVRKTKGKGKGKTKGKTEDSPDNEPDQSVVEAEVSEDPSEG